MGSPGFMLGTFVACLHWWQFQALCNNFGPQLMAGRVVSLSIRRWGLTVLLGLLSLQFVQVKPGDFLTGFLVASFAVRMLLAFRFRLKPQ